MNKNIIKLGIFLFISFVIALPFFIDWFIIANTFPSNISNSDWVSFLGSYCGAIIGFIGIIATILFTNKQNDKNRELSVKPLLSITNLNLLTDDFIDKNDINLIDSVIITTVNKNIDKDDADNCCVVNVQNIGLGPAVNIKCSLIYDYDYIHHQRLNPLQFKYKNISNINKLGINDSAYIAIIEQFEFNIPSAQEICRFENTNDSMYVSSEYKTYNIKLNITFESAYGHSYTDIYNITLKPLMTTDFNGNYKYYHEVFIECKSS